MDHIEYPELETTVQIKEHHLDTFGHVNNAAYLEIFEGTRWEIITDRGYGLKEIQEHQKGPVILDVQLKFKKELKNREKVKVTFKVAKARKKIMVVEQKMIKGDGTVACEASFTVGYFDLKERKLIEPNDDWYRACGDPRYQ